MNERVAVVGAGLAGCLLATLLGRRGIEVTLYERREDPRVTGAERGRSINLAISARGLAALERVGLREEALARALPMHGRMVHPPHGKQNFQPYSADGTRAINSISRAELNAALLDVADKTPGVTVRFGARLTSVDLDSGVLAFADGTTAEADVVLASDGSYSAARRAVTFRPGFTFSQDYMAHGYKELTIPSQNGEFALDPDALHIWPRGTSMMIALPNLDRSFTCTLFWPHALFESVTEPDAYFKEHYPDVVDLMPTLAEDYRLNPVGSLVTIRCWPWVHHGEASTVALVGDAAHAIVPFFGQGANCALEDCIEIDDQLARGLAWPDALAAYEQQRKANCDTIAELALENFTEMSDKVNSPLFRAKSAAIHALERRVPNFVSRYELVSFSTVPYAEIPARMRKQNLALAGIGLTALAAAIRASGSPRGRGTRA